ncbi:hypothetical protein Tcan_16253 [Toxocara canis]|uniref:Uncharacterized protein n=1 Tax=Toxocara canis TaxID=6265 RepID=A0A0B2V244_TOXCA|nr:hypothetical protein Tcan_16253 [Toxocara canis]
MHGNYTCIRYPTIGRQYTISYGNAQCICAAVRADSVFHLQCFRNTFGAVQNPAQIVESRFWTNLGSTIADPKIRRWQSFVVQRKKPLGRQYTISYGNAQCICAAVRADSVFHLQCFRNTFGAVQNPAQIVESRFWTNLGSTIADPKIRRWQSFVVQRKKPLGRQYTISYGNAQCICAAVRADSVFHLQCFRNTFGAVQNPAQIVESRFWTNLGSTIADPKIRRWQSFVVQRKKPLGRQYTISYGNAQCICAAVRADSVFHLQCFRNTFGAVQNPAQIVESRFWTNLGSTIADPKIRRWQSFVVQRKKPLGRQYTISYGNAQCICAAVRADSVFHLQCFRNTFGAVQNPAQIVESRFWTNLGSTIADPKIRRWQSFVVQRKKPLVLISNMNQVGNCWLAGPIPLWGADYERATDLPRVPYMRTDIGNALNTRVPGVY